MRWGRGTKATGKGPARSPQQDHGCGAATRPNHLPALSSSAPLPRSGPRAPSPDRLRGGRADRGGAPRAQGLFRSWGGPLLHPLAGPGNRTLFASAVNGLAPLLGSETRQGSPDHLRPRFAAVRGSGPPQEAPAPRGRGHAAHTRAGPPPSRPFPGRPRRTARAQSPRAPHGTAAVTRTLAPHSQ